MPSEGTATCIDILLAIILPPLGVFLKFGCKVEGDGKRVFVFVVLYFMFSSLTV